MKLFHNLKKRYTKINCKICVHTLPDGLKPPFEDSQQYSKDTYRVYQLVIDSKLFWRIWMIDEYEQKWVEVDFENKQGKDEFYILVIEEGTYRKVAFDEYAVLT